MARVSHEGQVTRVRGGRQLARKAEVIALEWRQAEEERAALDARYAEAESSVGLAGRGPSEGRRAPLGVATVSWAARRRGRAEREGGGCAAALAAMIERTSALHRSAAVDERRARWSTASPRAPSSSSRRGFVAGPLQASQTRLERSRRYPRARGAADGGADADAAEITVRVKVEGRTLLFARPRGARRDRTQASELDVARANAQSDLGQLGRCAPRPPSAPGHVLATSSHGAGRRSDARCRRDHRRRARS